MTLKLTRLLNADGETVGYFSDHVAEMAARREWNDWYDVQASHAYEQEGVDDPPIKRCRSVETPVSRNICLEVVEPGDGERLDCFYEQTKHPLAQAQMRHRIDAKIDIWIDNGAVSVEVRRYLVNRYRRPGMSNRAADLGGPVEAAGVLYVLTVKAPK